MTASNGGTKVREWFCLNCHEWVAEHNCPTCANCPGCLRCEIAVWRTRVV